MQIADSFVNWNKALYNHFFREDLEEDEEVSLFIDRATVHEIGQTAGLGGYDDLLHCIMLPFDERKRVYIELRQSLGLGIELSPEQRQSVRSSNLFDFATIYIDKDFDRHFNCPLYLIYLVFAVLMGGECRNLGRMDIGGYITERLRESFPNHSDRRNSLNDLFSSLAEGYPQFRARRLTKYVYIGLIQYQLILSSAQENSLKSAMFNADLSDDLPYEVWVRRLRDYTDASLRQLLNESIENTILRSRFSSLRSSFDPILYEQRHENLVVSSRGKFVLAVFEDEYSADNDRLVLLTDINNKTITDGHLTIKKGSIDRLGEFAQYNINHVLIGSNDKAEMKRYTLQTDTDTIASAALGNIVTFSRFNSCYLIQTDYPQKGKETYIFVRNSCEQEWSNWLHAHGSPEDCDMIDSAFTRRLCGDGWRIYVSKEIERNLDTDYHNGHCPSILIEGGIRCIGMNNVYLINALPYFEFPESIQLERLSIYINIDNKLLDGCQYIPRIVDENKLIIDLRSSSVGDYSYEVSITLEYTKEDNSRLFFHDDFSVIGQDIRYNDGDLLSINMWGGLRDNDNGLPFMKGFRLFNLNNSISLPDNTILYQNREPSIDIDDKRFLLVNLFTAICSMRSSFSATESQLEKCVRYAATRFDISDKVNNSFYRDLKYLLINCGYINADYDKRKYQPIPPTFVSTLLATTPGRRLYLLMGSYTKKFLSDLKRFCEKNRIEMIQHSISNSGGAASLLPPIILLGYNFAPDRFINETACRCTFIPKEDLAINIIRAIPTFRAYERTLSHVDVNVLPSLADTHNMTFPRIRESRATGYGASHWIEQSKGSFNKITIPDLAWAELYCLYQAGMKFCTKDGNNLLFPVYLHLPVMMQRALYIANLGVPKKEKTFICFSDKTDRRYWDLIKQYEIKETMASKRMSKVIEAITGKDDDTNSSLRISMRCPNYRLYYWRNKQKQSSNPRSILVMKDRTGDFCYGFATKCGEDMRIYFYYGVDQSRFKRVDGSNVNAVFSKFMTSAKTWEQLGISFKEEYASLPSIEEYEEEEIKII